MPLMHILFTIDRLTHPPIAILSELFSTEKSNEFAYFFSNPVKGDQPLIIQCCAKKINSHQQPREGIMVKMARFDAIDYRNLEEILHYLKPSI